MKFTYSLIIAFCFGFLFLSCNKTIDTASDNALAENKTAIKNYINSKNLKNVVETASGLNYTYLVQNNTGIKPNIGDEITIHYKLFRVTDGVVIDSSDRAKAKPLSFAYTGKTVLIGMEEVFNFMKKGERMVLLMPNNLAYGPQTSSTVPAYSAIGVDMEMVNVRTEPQQIKDYVAKRIATLQDSILKRIVKDSTSSGLRIVKTTITTKPLVANGATVKLNYIGKLLSGTEFDAGTFSFVLGSGTTIKGFDEGVSKMRIGEKALIVFPSAIGYGPAGSGTTIPPYAPLAFEIEIVQ